tara:strand:+ start:31 stop:501 length:471 start_codon:yes stop_codon:yes gene_type:complete
MTVTDDVKNVVVRNRDSGHISTRDTYLVTLVDILLLLLKYGEGDFQHVFDDLYVGGRHVGGDQLSLIVHISGERVCRSRNGQQQGGRKGLRFIFKFGHHSVKRWLELVNLLPIIPFTTIAELRSCVLNIIVISGLPVVVTRKVAVGLWIVGHELLI